MNILDATPAPPIGRGQSQPGEHLVGLHIGIRANVVTAALWPPKNLCATQILLRLLADSLTVAGVQTRPGGAGGELNDSLYLFHVRNRLRAVRILKAKLAEVKLLGYAQLAVFDADELYWRTLFPETDQPFAAYLDMEHYCTHLTRLQNLMADWQQQLARLNPAPATQPLNEGPDGN